MSHFAPPDPGEADDDVLARLVEEVADRLRAGEAVDLEEYAGRHPERAEELRRLLPALELLAAAGSGQDGPGPLTAAEDGSVPLRGLLGDFRILREVGRGGMGVVYEAEQLSLGRRVALKVLPLAATMDPRHLQRFHNEARAAAGLHHPHIVPVYAVGCERGVHYYAMQFIEGKSLAGLIAAQDVASRGGQPPGAGVEATDHGASPGEGPPTRALADTRTGAAAPTDVAPRDAAYFRRIAEWGTQAAEALEHAHALGIVHRDVKPANLIADGQGKLWVTDFGLARTVTDAGLTMSGDLLGTLRYMSPEQALARHGLVDHRTDIYSLGATLYELLTGRPAVEGQDRQVILKRIADEEPRPPRALDRGVPTDLETIVLKAMAKEPAERYPSGRELADDLGLWLRGAPIQARPVSRLSRLWRWCRRNRAVAGLAAAVTVLAIGSIVGLSTATAVVWREQKATKTALAEAQANYARAQAQRRRAENNFGKVLDGMTGFLEELDANKELNQRQRVALRQALADHMERFFQKLQDEARADPVTMQDEARTDLVTRMEMGWAYLHLGAFYVQLNDYAQAEKKDRQALEVLEPLANEYPDDQGVLWVYSLCLARLGTVLFLKGETAEARAFYRRAVQQYRHWLAIDPSGRAEYEFAHFLLHSLDVELQNPAEALQLATRIVKRAPEAPASWYLLGRAHFRAGEWWAARHGFEEVIRLRGHGFTSDYFHLAMTHWKLGEQDRARQYYDLGVKCLMDPKGQARRSVTLRRLQAEAAALLGVPERPAPKGKEELLHKD
jgi:serine/threonine protein kinase/tetratricopeptide (TPR) repeat protein